MYINNKQWTTLPKPNKPLHKKSKTNKEKIKHIPNISHLHKCTQPLKTFVSKKNCHTTTPLNDEKQRWPTILTLLRKTNHS
jgi:hypothetical protein